MPRSLTRGTARRGRSSSLGSATSAPGLIPTSREGSRRWSRSALDCPPCTAPCQMATPDLASTSPRCRSREDRFWGKAGAAPSRRQSKAPLGARSTVWWHRSPRSGAGAGRDRRVCRRPWALRWSWPLPGIHRPQHRISQRLWSRETQSRWRNRRRQLPSGSGAGARAAAGQPLVQRSARRKVRSQLPLLCSHISHLVLLWNQHLLRPPMRRLHDGGGVAQELAVAARLRISHCRKSRRSSQRRPPCR